jgi:hypothetical protein
MGPEDLVDQKEKRRIIREQGGTFHAHGMAQADEINQGRFAVTGGPNVTGSTPVPSYPQASAPFQRDPVPDEPPLGVDINAMPFELSTVSMSHPAVEQLAPAGAAASLENLPPTADESGDAGASLFSNQETEDGNG